MFDLMTSTKETATVTMSSREIAAIIGKEHKHVCRDVQNMMEQLKGVDSPDLDDVDFKGVFVKRKVYNGRKVIDEIILDREHTECLVTGYSAVLRMKVIKRLHELEEQVAKPALDLNNPAALRTMLLGYTEKVIELEEKIVQDAPKVAYAEAVEVSPNCV